MRFCDEVMALHYDMLSDLKLAAYRKKITDNSLSLKIN